MAAYLRLLDCIGSAGAGGCIPSHSPAAPQLKFVKRRPEPCISSWSAASSARQVQSGHYSRREHRQIHGGHAERNKVQAGLSTSQPAVWRATPILLPCIALPLHGQIAPAACRHSAWMQVSCYLTLCLLQEKACTSVWLSCQETDAWGPQRDQGTQEEGPSHHLPSIPV